MPIHHLTSSLTPVPSTETFRWTCNPSANTIQHAGIFTPCFYLLHQENQTEKLHHACVETLQTQVKFSLKYIFHCIRIVFAEIYLLNAKLLLGKMGIKRSVRYPTFSYENFNSRVCPFSHSALGFSCVLPLLVWLWSRQMYLATFLFVKLIDNELSKCVASINLSVFVNKFLYNLFWAHFSAHYGHILNVFRSILCTVWGLGSCDEGVCACFN